MNDDDFTPYDRQAIFDKVVSFARKQNKKSVDPTTRDCLYRGPKGIKCFIGCLIPNSRYSKDLEGSSIQQIEVQKAAFGVSLSSKDVRFMFSLQRIHDDHDPSDWNIEFEKFAKNYGLNYHDDNT